MLKKREQFCCGLSAGAAWSSVLKKASMAYTHWPLVQAQLLAASNRSNFCNPGTPLDAASGLAPFLGHKQALETGF